MLRNKLLGLLILCMALFSNSGFAKTLGCSFGDNGSGIQHWSVVYSQDRIVINNTIAIFPFNPTIFRGSTQYWQAVYTSDENSFMGWWNDGSKDGKMIICWDHNLPKRFRNLKKTFSEEKEFGSNREEVVEVPSETTEDGQTSVLFNKEVCMNAVEGVINYGFVSQFCGWNGKHKDEHALLLNTLNKPVCVGFTMKDFEEASEKWKNSFDNRSEDKSKEEVCEMERASWHLVDEVR